MFTQRNTGYLFIGGTATISTSNFSSSLNTDEIGIFTKDGVRMTQALAATEDYFVIAAKQADGVVVQSPVLAKADITKATVQTYSAPVNQVDYIGFNGTSGSIAVLNDEYYSAYIELQELLRSNTDGKKLKHVFYTSDSSATQAEIADGLFQSIVNNFDREPEAWIYPAMLMDNGNDAAVGTSVDNVTFTKGSKTISSSNDIDDGTGSAAFAVGDYIRVPDGSRYDITLTGTSGTATVTVNGMAQTATFDTNLATTAANFVTNFATAYSTVGVTVTNPSGAILTFVKDDWGSIATPTATNATGDLAGTVAVDSANDFCPVYRITAIDATNNNATLSVPYQGETITHADTVLNRITAANAAAEECGLVIAGRAPAFVAGKEKAEVVRWVLSLNGSGSAEGFSSTTLTNSIGASNGHGSVNQIAEMEWFYQGNEGEYYREGFSTIHPSRSNVNSSVAGLGYDLINLVVDSKNTPGVVQVTSPIQLILATPATTPNYALNATADDITDVLEVLAFGAAGAELSLG